MTTLQPGSPLFSVSVRDADQSCDINYHAGGRKHTMATLTPQVKGPLMCDWYDDVCYPDQVCMLIAESVPMVWDKIPLVVQRSHLEQFLHANLELSKMHIHMRACLDATEVALAFLARWRLQEQRRQEEP